MTFRELINKYKTICIDKNLEIEAVKFLILELTGYDAATLLLKYEDSIEQNILNQLICNIEKYVIDYLPVQYILGYTYFCGNKLNVNQNVLIPRSETEELVFHVEGYYKNLFLNKKVNICDIGTGSGAIAIALAKNNNFNVTATDISPDALEIACNNALMNDVKINFYEGDLLKPLIEKQLKFDILVSNPPYVASSDLVDPLVLKNEPHLALFADNDGMSCYENILKDAHKILNFPNIILFEHGFEQKILMENLINKYFPKATYEILKDINGNDRFTVIINK